MQLLHLLSCQSRGKGLKPNDPHLSSAREAPLPGYDCRVLGEQFIYVGIGGTQDKLVRERDPRSRIREHRSGRRSGNQFCCYVHDYYVIPELVRSGEFERKKRYLDILTRDYIHRNLRYRVKGFQTEDSVKIVRELEKKIQRGFFGTPPVLNGLPESW